MRSLALEKAILNKLVLSLVLNVCNVEVEMTSIGRLFHNPTAAQLNARSPERPFTQDTVTSPLSLLR